MRRKKEWSEKQVIETKYRGQLIQSIKDLLSTDKNLNSVIVKKLNESKISAKDAYEIIEENNDYFKKKVDEFRDGDPKDYILICSIFTIITKLKSRNMSKYAGCYRIKNITTNEVYIGETIDSFRRFTQHVSDLYNNTHHCKKLQDAFNETRNFANFIFEPLFVIEINPDISIKEIKEEVLYLEAAYYLIYKFKKIDLYNTLNPYTELKKGLNLHDQKVDYKNVLQLLIDDKYNVLPNKLWERIKDNLLEYGIKPTTIDKAKKDEIIKNRLSKRE